MLQTLQVGMRLQNLPDVLLHVGLQLFDFLLHLKRLVVVRVLEETHQLPERFLQRFGEG